jgi:6-pyruvoyltetrahydropterin/6-carboxytetrahydropterin synthase
VTRQRKQPSITVRHNIEVAHRLFLLPGKCENIHGHSMWVEMTLSGELDANGILCSLDFGHVKSQFRKMLDTRFDHHILLNEEDPWARPITLMDEQNMVEERLPGLIAVPGDPTTENIAKWIAKWAFNEFNLPVDVTVHETSVNAASYSATGG